eukprot:3991494-Prymnesium_polylepis.1
MRVWSGEEVGVLSAAVERRGEGRVSRRRERGAHGASSDRRPTPYAAALLATRRALHCAARAHAAPPQAGAQLACAAARRRAARRPVV